MPNRSSKNKKEEKDVNVLAARIVEPATDEEQDRPTEEPTEPEQPQKNPAAVELGRLGGKKGGRARAEKLSPKKRKEIAKKAAEARWKKQY